MVSYTYQMPSGIPGAITRPEVATIEAALLSQSTPPTVFGVAVKKVSNALQPIGAGDTAASVVGVLVRPFPTSGNGTDGLGVSTPNKGLPGNLLKRGYINALVNNFASVPPVAQGKVYVRIANASTGKVVGNFEAANEITTVGTATGGNTGNGTIGTLSSQDVTPTGTYTAKFTAATAYNVLDASGAILGAGVTGTQLTLDNGLSFKITAGGTAFVSGDTFSIVVTDNTILVPGNTYFTGGVDAYGNAEVAYNI